MMLRPQDKPALVPDPPREVPRWFFVRRMQALAFSGVLCIFLAVAMGVGLSSALYATTGQVSPGADLALDREHASATGVITATRCMSNVSVGNRHPWRVAFSFTTQDGAAVEAVGYSLGPTLANQRVGESIGVEYDPADPSRARPAGGTVAVMPLWCYLLVVGILGAEVVPGLILLVLVWLWAGRERILLTHGVGTDAEVIQVRRIWHIRFGWRNPFDVYYRFGDRMGRGVIGKDRTYHYAWADALEPGQKIGVVYNPHAPEANALWLHGKDVGPGSTRRELETEANWRRS